MAPFADEASFPPIVFSTLSTYLTFLAFFGKKWYGRQGWRKTYS